MSLRINGYSERGMVNAVCEDIMHARGVQRLATPLSWCRFPFQPEGVPDFGGITAAHILVEQSFSDFGDLDLLFLLDHADRKQSVLIEAKVATDTSSPKRIDDQWEDFLSFLQGDADQTSSLFVQLYRKLRLIERVADLNRPFDPHPLWGRQSLGANRVVLKAARLLADYREHPWYVALVPDDSHDVARFFSSTLRDYRPDPHQLPGWDVRRMGYLTWPELHDHVREEPAQAQWQRTLSAFEWNEHQIYQRRAVAAGEVAVGTVALWNGQRIVIVITGKRTHRAILEVSDTTRFPKSFPVSVDEVNPLAEARVETALHQPARGTTYNWNPPTMDPIQPPDRAPVPTPPQLVKVRQGGWETTRVIRVNAAGSEEGDEFHVFNHHLQREVR
jgi:hypothetical protein